MAALLERGGCVSGVTTTDGAAHEADLVLVAAGAWTPVLLPHLGDRLWATAQPVVHLAPADPAPFRAERFPVWAADVAETGWYGFPALPDGRLKIANHGPGRPLDPRGPRAVLPAERERAQVFAAASWGVVDAPVALERLCLYCDSFDGDFWVDRDPERPGLAVAAGGSGHAFKFLPVLGELVADACEGRLDARYDRWRWRAAGGAPADPMRSRGAK